MRELIDKTRTVRERFMQRGLFALALGVAMSASSSADTLYLQPFINPTGRDMSSLRVSWYTHYGGSGDMVSWSRLGNPTGSTSLAPIPATEPAEASGRGYIYGAPPSSAADHLFWTDLIALNDSGSLETISWDQRNGSTSYAAHAALQIDGQWYVADTGFNSSGSDWESKTFSLSGATWKELNFQPGVSLALGAAAPLPNGQVTGAGAYVPLMSSHTRFDNFAIEGPSSSYDDATVALYREIFPNDSGSARTISGTVEGWKLHYDVGGAFNNAQIVYDYVCPALPPVNASPEQDNLTYGYIYNMDADDSNDGKDFLYWTEEYTIDSVGEVGKVQWYQSNTSNTDGFRLALKIGAEWYASDTEFTNLTGQILSQSTKKPEWTRNELALDETTWQILNFTEGSELALSGTSATLPTGTAITAWGLYTPSFSDTQRIDDFLITPIPIPEPSMAVLMLSMLVAVVARRREG